MELGSRLGDRFELLARVGAGGMATVFRARDLRTGELVAVKVLESGGQLTARFEREVLALEQLTHPGIVRYVAHGEGRDGQLYLAMEWLEGEDLATVLERQPLGVRASLRLAKRLCEALAVAHARGIIHRDIKPSNLFLVDGEVDGAKVIDFGVAHLHGAARAVTHTGIIVGTPGYLAPEQARGGRDIDARVDLFAVGCVLFECIAGRPAFEADRVLALLAKVLFAGAPRLADVARDVPPEVDALVAELLASEPDHRPADAATAAARIDDVLASREVASRGRASGAPSIGDLEQQLLSVVVAAGARAADGRTMSMTDLAERHLALREVAARFGARFEPVVDGSAVMTLAGRGDARDQALRAARCALAVHRAAPALAVAVATGSGVMSGHVPVGEVIDRAVAVVDEAASEVCADDVTAGLIDEQIEVHEESGRRILREPSVRARRGRTLLGRAMPCVGRTRELRMLEAVASQAFDESAASVVLLSGEAGAGKSRVRDELVQKLAGEGTDVWIGRAEPMRVGSPFSVITGALVTALGLPLDRSAEERRRAITEHVARVVAAEDAPRVSLFLAEILGAARADEGDVRIQAARRDPELMADQVRLAVVDFTTAWCAKNPLVIVLEDLQWADAPSVRAIDQLLATARDLPLLVVGVARPEVFDRFPDLWARRVPQEIKVGALPRRAAEELVRSALGADTAPDVIERLIGASQGNAFFLEELVRAEAAGRGEETPPTVLAVVRARLEAMEPEARRVMRAASIFGRRFFSAGVAALVGRDVRDAIARLEEQEVLSRRAEASAPGEPDFAFRHDLMRDAAYAMLTSDDRTLGHRLAAKWLAGRPGVPAVVLAEHFELGGMRERAAPLWARAAADALDGNDLEECLHSAGQVFEPALSFEQRGQLALVRAEALIWRGDHAGAEGQAKEAIRLLPQGSDAWCQAMTELVTARSRHGASAVSDVAEELLAATEEGTPSVAVSGMLARLALTLRHGGLPALATRVAVRVRQAASGHADPTVEGWLHRLAASEALFEGDLGTYLAEERAARDCFTAIGATRRSVLSTVNVGYALLELGAYRDAERALREAVEVTTRTGLGQLATVAQQNLGRALAANGRLREAVELERTTARAAADAGDVRLEGGSLLYLAQIHLELGELEDAEEAARSAVERLSALPTLAPYGGAVLARVMLARGRADDALELTRRAVEGLDEVGELEEGETLVLLVRAEALAEAGRIEEASEAIARAKAVVQARASRIRDPELRRSFLEKVADNARVTEM